jgi:NAD(P)-dependent dehydrogenase (short-subunit alcohol dehydrogenase family)
VRLNAIAPGAVDTPLLQATLADSELGPLVRAFPIPCGRFGRATEIADGILFLLGPAASFCCGSVLFVDGGTDALVRPTVCETDTLTSCGRSDRLRPSSYG